MQHLEPHGVAFDMVGISDFTSFVAGVDIRMVSERLGHSNILITSNTYQHVIKGMQAGAAQKVADLLFGSETRQS